jgi:hypothetical protein
MTYANQATLAADLEFYGRVTACTQEQANTFKDDGRPDIAALAENVLADSGLTSWFIWLVATQPGFGDTADGTAITDGQILSAVQAVWPTVAAVHTPPA